MRCSVFHTPTGPAIVCTSGVREKKCRHCNLYQLVTREDSSLLSKEVSFRKRNSRVGSRDNEKKFVFIRAFAVFRNHLKLPPGFLYRTSTGKPCIEIAAHLFNLKLDAHFHPFLTLHRGKLYYSQLAGQG